MNNDNRYHLNRISLIAKGQGAFLGAAVGDALGWPQEPEAKRVDNKNAATESSNGFQQWVRKSGGPYYPHEEIILAVHRINWVSSLYSPARMISSCV